MTSAFPETRNPMAFAQLSCTFSCRFVTARVANRSKVMFSQASVCPSQGEVTPNASWDSSQGEVVWPGGKWTPQPDHLPQEGKVIHDWPHPPHPQEGKVIDLPRPPTPIRSLRVGGTHPTGVLSCSMCIALHPYNSKRVFQDSRFYVKNDSNDHTEKVGVFCVPATCK